MSQLNSASLVVLDVEEAADWSITVQGLLHGKEFPFVEADETVEIERYREFFRETMNGFKLSLNDSTPESCGKVQYTCMVVYA